MNTYTEAETVDKHRTIPAVWIYISLAAASLALGYFTVVGPGFHLYEPILYQGDPILILSMIKRVMEGHWVYSTWLMGTPFGSATYDYPIPDTGSLIALKVFGLATGSAIAAYNIYYFVGFALNALAGYAVLRALGLSKTFSFAGALIFTLLPFHFLRIQHLFYTWYFAAPAFTWFALRAYRGELDFFNGRAVRAQILDAALLLALTCFGVYYAFFGTLAILTAGLARFLKARALVSIRGTIIAAVVVLAGTVVNVAPTIAYHHVYGKNHEDMVRLPVEAELYGLKIAQLVLPRSNHRIPVLARANAVYSSTFPLVNENATASLGIVGTLGFIALLLALFAPKERLDERFSVLSMLTISLLICCTIGGFSAVFALAISPLIRAWNRASVFIAFFSVAALMMVVQTALERAKRFVVPATAIALVLIAIFDQTTPVCTACLAGQADLYRQDSSFVANIEKDVPAGSMIYQLPYMAFPEANPIGTLGSYDEAIGFLHSKTLRWSFGGMKGRPGDLFYRALAQKPIDQQMAEIKKMGFDGVWVDRRGYADNGTAIVGEITKVLGVAPAAQRADGAIVFFKIPK